DRREHGFVRDAVQAALDPLTESLATDGETSALTLARGRHLYAGLRGRLRDGVSIFDVLAALHPTPAVGGTPRGAAVAAIAEREPFDRGLYAGPVGWIGRDAAELAVGIRSGLVRGDGLDLFSGAGLVEGSDPAAEWAEYEHKIGDFALVLGGGGLARAPSATTSPLRRTWPTSGRGSSWRNWSATARGRSSWGRGPATPPSPSRWPSTPAIRAGRPA